MWEKVVRKMRTGMMPPPGEPRPARGQIDAFSTQLEGRLDASLHARPNPGSKSLHRLNRTEYANAIRDLLAFDLDVTTMLPADDSAEGFDNIADVLSVSPTLVQSQVAAAMKISRAVTGETGMVPVLARYDGPGGAAQSEHLEGLPIGTRGGVRFTHYFPLDAEYEFRIAAGAAFRFAGHRGGARKARHRHQRRACEGGGSPALPAARKGRTADRHGGIRGAAARHRCGRPVCALRGASRQCGERDHPGAVRCDRCGRHAEPPRHLHLPPRQARG